MSALYSAPPFWLFYFVIMAMLIWGFICGRVRRTLVGVFLLPVPYLVWAIYIPGLFSDMGAVFSFLWYSLLFMLPSYGVALFSARTIRKKAKEVTPNLKKATPHSANFLLNFLLLIVYVAAITVSIQYYFGHSFPLGYILTAIVTIIASISFILVAKFRHVHQI